MAPRAWKFAKGRTLSPRQSFATKLHPSTEGVLMAKSKRTKRRERLASSGYILIHPAPKKKPVDVKTDSFLSTYEWRKVRMLALKKYGPRCQCCGATPKDGAVMNVDHIKPRKLFPDLALDVNNLQILCHECNHGKGNWDKTDWR
jgi:5-methylcytosine-specific restriction endonuclease McrA